MTIRKVANNISDISQLYPFKKKILFTARDIAILLFSTFSKIDSSKEWIRVIFYHHVFDDERKDFERHLRYLRKYGDFISLDTVVDILEKNEKICGRYFCVTFDDGFKNCITNALPILVENECLASFFIATDYIGCNVEEHLYTFKEKFSGNKNAYPIPVEFMNWDDCKNLLEAGMIIGSHTCSHVPLSELDDNQLKSELVKSKQKIEEKLGIDCIHFAAPLGVPGKHFIVGNDPIIAKTVGYRSFLTTERGPNYKGTDPFRIRRDGMFARCGNHALRFFLSESSQNNFTKAVRSLWSNKIYRT